MSNGSGSPRLFQQGDRDLVMHQGEILYLNTTPETLRQYQLTLRPQSAGYAFSSFTDREYDEIDGIKRFEILPQAAGKPLSFTELTRLLRQDFE